MRDGGSFKFKFIGLSLERSREKAKNVCSSSFSGVSYQSIRDSFEQEISLNQLVAFTTCLDSVSKASDVEIQKYTLTANKPEPPQTIPNGKDVSHYSFSMTFRWIPSSTRLKDTVVTIAKNHSDQIVDCKMNPSDPAIKPSPGWTEQFNIKSNTFYVYSCEAVRRVRTPIITFAIRDGSPITLVFPST